LENQISVGCSGISMWVALRIAHLVTMEGHSRSGRALKEGGSHTCSFGHTPASKGYVMASYIFIEIMLLK
jgi:hypothetical protein